MLVRIKFEGIVEFDGTKSTLPDHVDIHVAPEKGLLHAKEIFLSWMAKSSGIKGTDTNVFHPLSGWGDIKIKNVVEMFGGEEGLCLVESTKETKCPKKKAEVSLSSPTQETSPPLSPKTKNKKRSISKDPSVSLQPPKKNS